MVTTQSTTLPTPEPLGVRVEEAARLVGLGRSTVYALIAKGEIPVVRVLRTVRVPLAPLRAWYAAHTTGGTR